MPTVCVTLPERLHAFVEAQVAKGAYGSVSDYIQGLIAEAEISQARAEIDMALLAGVEALERGEGRELTTADWQRLQARIQQPDGQLP